MAGHPCADSATAWQKCVWPYGSPDKTFDARDPCLGCADLSATDRARTYNRAVVHDMLLSKISAGEPGADSLHQYCKALVSITRALPEGEEAVLATVVTEIGVLADGLLALLAPDLESPAFLEKVDELMQGGAEADDSRSLVQKGLQQSSFYRSLERDLRKTALGCQTLLPDTALHIEKLSKDSPKVQLEGLEGVAKKMAIWAENLPPSRLEGVWSGAKKACFDLVKSCNIPSLDALIAVCSQLQELPGGHREWCDDVAKAALAKKQRVVKQARQDEVHSVIKSLLQDCASALRV